MSRYTKVDQKDNIAVAITDLKEGLSISINNTGLSIKEHIRAKHKFALKDFNQGDDVIMYGVLVGRATQSISKGCAITVNNIKHASATYNNSGSHYYWTPPDISKYKDKTFWGYHRKDGSVGTSNNWLVIPLVFCENRNVELLEEILSKALGYGAKKDFVVEVDALVNRYRAGATETEIYDTPIISSYAEMMGNRVFQNIDGIKFLKHDGGCGGTRQDAEMLCKLLAGYITHANVAGATILSLGCQNAQIDLLKEAIWEKDPEFSKPLYFVEQQKSGSQQKLLEEAVKHTFVGLARANQNTREPAPLDKLVLGLECGGSDGFSGISANPSLGHASDLLVALGGSAVLAEFPELNGVEQELINRSETQELGEKFTRLMDSYTKRALAVGSGFENNPSPGNIKDGLITDAMKSAGAAKKGGSSPIKDVLDYGETVVRPGLNLLCTPGNDVESTTGLAGSGCNLIVFTTGLGTPTGNPIAPVVKVSSNTPLFERMNDIIDINAGTVISGEESIQSMGERLLDHIIEVASGTITVKAELNGQNDFIPWKRGVSL
ncbi:UxaA family hydrolase [Allomuricauda sp. SCSIO 65647]|uniref:UxaA family hydrolase n=1 Tax=Allomuricauda sp. SCSIO 65647 TaxID=2908843 RepID=UPI001F2C8791|nr:altronate dehydratase family protein [Muricauda sp. SCSIO 65647]UJH68584.1 altronate dehydratase family protein [Muricauda sp. SCSIO 65647]